MKVAIAYDYLNQLGGGERVLKIISDMFPDAPIYTLFYNEELTKGVFKNKKIITSFLDRPEVHARHRLFIPIMPIAAESMRISDEYDTIISLGAGYAQGMRYGKHAKHLYYCFTPLRYAWEKKYIPPSLRYIAPLTIPLKIILRYWNYYSAKRPHTLLTLSHFIAQERILPFFKRSANVVYPPINDDVFYYDPTITPQKYYLAVGRLLHYKKFDMIIDACQQRGCPLKIVGEGPEYSRLKRRITTSNIEILGRVEKDKDVRLLYAGARACLFPQIEDFGLVCAEAQVCGTPVIAFAGGGALEIVRDGRTGVFFPIQTVESLASAIQRFETIIFDRAAIAESAQRFSRARFKESLTDHLKNLTKENI